MTKILTVFTGGTIGSKSSGGILRAAESAKYELIDIYRRRCGEGVRFDVTQPLNTLSENISPDSWQAIYNELAARNLSAYSGIIITHGSDTLGYTAALFSFLLCKLPIPVVFVAADRALGDPLSNGGDNFVNAVKFIQSSPKKAPKRGVFAVFRRADDRHIVYSGARLMQCDQFDRFASFGGVDCGEMIDGEFVPSAHGESGAVNEKSRPEGGASRIEDSGFTLCPLRLPREVMLLSPYPGIHYGRIDLDPPPAAVLHLLYHSSTACTAGDGSLITFAERCRGAGIPLFLLDCRHFSDGKVYETADQLMSCGAVPLSGLSPVAAFSKLFAAYAQSEMPQEEYMKKNIAGEFLRV